MDVILDTLAAIRRDDEVLGNRDFAEALRARLLESEHISIHEEDASSLQALVNTYCNHIGYEFEHCNTEAERQFFLHTIEDPTGVLSKAGLKELEWSWIYEQLYRTAMFETLVRERYPTARTFGIEGMEAGGLAINTIVETFASAAAGSNNNSRVVLGTTHRGRLNILASCL